MNNSLFRVNNNDPSLINCYWEYVEVSIYAGINQYIFLWTFIFIHRTVNSGDIELARLISTLKQIYEFLFITPDKSCRLIELFPLRYASHER